MNIMISNLLLKLRSLNEDKFVECIVGQPFTKKELKFLQELVDKETPIKVVKWELAKPETRCAKCGAGLERYHDYCWGCGQKLDWSEKK